MPCVGGICTPGKGKAPEQISLGQLRQRQQARLQQQGAQQQGAQQPVAQPQAQMQQQAPAMTGMQGSAAPQPGSHEWMMQNNPYYRETMARHANLPQQPPAQQPTGTVRYQNGQQVPLTEANYNRFTENLPQGHPSRQFMEQQAPTYQYAQPGMFSGMESGIGQGLSGLLGGNEARNYQSGVRAGKGGMQFPRFTPQQEQVMNQLMGMGLSEAQAMQAERPFDFGPQEEAARRGFQQRTIPSIMERFTGMAGGREPGRGSALPQQLAQAGQDLESNLAAQRSKFGLQSAAIRQGGVGQLLGQGLQQRFDTAFAPKGPGFASALGSGLGQAVGMAPAMLLRGLF